MLTHKKSFSRITLFTLFTASLPLLSAACNASPNEAKMPSPGVTAVITATTAPEATTVPIDVPTPEATVAPLTATPEVTQPPAETPVPDATATPTATTVPELTDIPEATTTPTVTSTPTTTILPETTIAPTETPTSTPPPAPTATPLPTATPTPTPTPSPTPALPTPQFSTEGGFYNTAFSLTLSCDDGEIYYTLDGSDPRTSKSALLYRDAIRIYNNTNEPNVYSAVKDISLGGYNPPSDPVDKGIVIRAVSKTSDGSFGDVITNSYFVGKTASYYTDMKVISLVTDSDYLFDPDTGAYMVGSGYYEWLKSDEYEPLDSGDNRNPTNYNKEGRETEFPVNIQVFEKGKAQYSANVGARISGNWSRAANQKSIRLYARSEYGSKKMKYPLFDDLTDENGELIKKFDKVTLRNGGNDAQFLHFRDALIQDLASDLAVDVMASEPYILFLDGEFWGFYLLREKPDGDYVESHYGIPEGNVTVIKNGGLESGSEEEMEAFRAFCDWAVTADMTIDSNYKRFCDTIDVQSFMDYMTVETYVCNSDWANGGLNNWMVWHSNTIDPTLPKADGKWRFIFYDLDLAAGLYGSAETSPQYDCLGTIHAPYSSFSYPEILRNLIKNDTFRQAFYDNYIHIVDTVFDTAITDAKITEYANTYGTVTADTFYRFDSAWSAHSYADGITGLKTFFQRRPTYAKKYLESYCNPDSPTTETPNTGNLIPSVDFWGYYGNAEFSASHENNTFLVNVPASSANAWDIQAQAGDFILEANQDYILTFTASCSASAVVDVGIQRTAGNEYPTCFWTSTNVTGEPKEFTYHITAEAETHSGWRVCFNFGNSAGSYNIHDVVLKKAN